MSVPSNSLARKPIDIEKEDQIAKDILLAAKLQRELQQEDIDTYNAIQSVKRLEEINNDTARRAESMSGEGPEERQLHPWSSWHRAIEPSTTTTNNNTDADCKAMNELIKSSNSNNNNSNNNSECKGMPDFGNKLELENLCPKIQKEEVVTRINVITKKEYDELLIKSLEVDAFKNIIEDLRNEIEKEHEENKKLRKLCSGLRKLNEVFRLTIVNEGKKDQIIIKENEKSPQEKHLPS